MHRIVTRGTRFKAIRSGRTMLTTRKIHRAPAPPTVALLNGAGASVMPTAVVRGGC